MNRSIMPAVVAAAAAGLLAPAHAMAQTNFEGVVTFRMNSESGRADTMVQTTKGRSIRMDGLGDKQGAFIYDADQKRIIMVEPRQKKAMVMTEDEQRQFGEMMKARAGGMRQHAGKDDDDEDEQNVSITKTGKTEVVAGTKCEVYHSSWVDRTGKKREGDGCIADGVGFAFFNAAFYDNPMFGGGQKRPKWMETFRKEIGPNRGVIKVVSYKDGKPSSDFEAIKIERKPVSADAFQPPAGYSVVNMGDMMRQMHQGMQKMQQQQGKPPTQ